jgi:hypothetical protein
VRGVEHARAGTRMGAFGDDFERKGGQVTILAESGNGARSPLPHGTVKKSPGKLKHASRGTCFSLSSSVLPDDSLPVP